MVDFANSLNYFAKGQQDAQAGLDTFTRARAGNALAKGDYAGGANALFRGGMIQEGAGVQQMQQQGEDRALRMEDRKLGIADKQREQKAAEAKAKGEFFMRAADVLSQIPDDGTQAQRRQSLQQLAPTFEAMGIDSQTVQTLMSADLSDQSLQAFKGSIAKELQAINLGNGGVAIFDKKAGTVRTVREPQYQQEYIALPAGGALVPKPRGDVPPQTVTAGGPSGAPTADPDQIIAPLTAMGARVTSGVRSPEDNARVGGVGNSFHLASRGGAARDLVPPPGMDMGRFEQEVKSRLPAGWEAVNEGDHIHIEPASGGAQVAQASGNYPAGTIMGPEKETARPATAEEKAAYGLNPNTPAQMRPDGSLAVITEPRAAQQRRVPAKVQAGYADNARSMAQIDNAIKQIEAYPKALGLIRSAGENINQRIDPTGVDARAALANIGSMIIHDRSGAAVTAAEAPRLMPFIPRVTDTPEAAIKKLKGLRRELENANAQIDVQFSEESGFSALAEPAAQAPAPKPPAAKAGGSTPPAAALKPGQITTFANGQRWTLRGGKPVRVN